MVRTRGLSQAQYRTVQLLHDGCCIVIWNFGNILKPPIALTAVGENDLLMHFALLPCLTVARLRSGKNKLLLAVVSHSI